MKIPTICRYCGGVIRLVPARKIYGASTDRLGLTDENIYLCQNFNARVGCHKGSNRPLGNVAQRVPRRKPAKRLRWGEEEGTELNAVFAAGGNGICGVSSDELRLKRRETHQVFDHFWQENGMTRTQAYKWLAGRMELPERNAHIGGFEMDQCQQVIDLCEKEWNKEAAA